ncbi:hypothetical protein GCM10009720_11140 [Yaniella flava]|uniref:DUF2516 family protein n=1 Tax=Yaniella flava TaxID=287930 RepID=A0ABP5FRC8_9MICC|nr:DUF2516 family protein [Micrococcaceae bacterium]
MDFLQLALMIEYGLQAALALVGAGMVIWAMADAARRSGDKFENHTNLTKSTWLLILGGALIFGLGSASLTVLYGGQIGLFGLASIVAAGVYLAGPKREFDMWSH